MLARPRTPVSFSAAAPCLEPMATTRRSGKMCEPVASKALSIVAVCQLVQLPFACHLRATVLVHYVVPSIGSPSIFRPAKSVPRSSRLVVGGGG